MERLENIVTIICSQCGDSAERRAGSIYCSRRCNMLVQTRKYYRRNADYLRPRARVRVREAYRADPEKHRKSGRESHMRHKEKRNAAARKYRLEHLERWTEINRAAGRRYSRTEKGKIAGANARAKRRSYNAGKIDLAAWKRKVRSSGGRCVFCKSQDKITIDHIIPLSKGGTNDIRNLQPLCNRCNAGKCAKILSGSQLILI